MKLLFTIAIFFFTIASYSQVEISSTTISPAAELDVTSPGNNGGVLIPTMTDAEMKLIVSPAHGLFVFNTDKNKFMYNIGTSASPNWTIMGELARMTGAEISAIALPVAGDMRYNTTSNSVWYYDGTSWQELNSTATPPY
ncbi:MAG: hypothetical protein IPO21_12570 [Bacteroidales bacterium]|nr:hypothetical protein [Bacteroidales bacterium]